jgi:hypothetical protein
MTTHHDHLDFSSETWDQPVKFFDGCWVVASRHNPGLLTSVELNNRVFVFELRGRSGKNVLLVLGCGGPSTIAAVHEIERKTGTKVAWVVGNGGGHHLFLSLWYDAFPDARVLIPAKRVPFTRNGQALQKKYAARWELMHGPRPKQLVDEFGSEIDVVIFDQLFHYDDENVAKIMASPKDHSSPAASLSGFSLLMAMGKAMKDTSHPNDEVTLFHRASGLVVGGHNYQFSFTPKGYSPPAQFKLKSGGFPMGFLMSMMMPKGRFVSFFEGQPGPLADSKIHVDEWRMVLGWDMRAWTSAHNPPTICGPDLSGAELKDAIAASLARTGEDDPTGARLKWNIKHKA